MNLEDAVELASWRTRPPLIVAEGRIVMALSPIPTLAEWLAEDDAGPADGD